MACKEDVCAWFKDCDPHSRLELLCCLLNMCLPLELHFVTTCLQELNKRVDLQEVAVSVNKEGGGMCGGDTLDQHTRSRLIVWVALLGATNTTGADMVVRVLTDLLPIPVKGDCVKEVTKEGDYVKKVTQEADCVMEVTQEGDYMTEVSQESDYMKEVILEGDYVKEVTQEGDCVKEVLLLYTMVLNHPAFTYQQKRVVAGLMATLLKQQDAACVPLPCLMKVCSIVSTILEKY